MIGTNKNVLIVGPCESDITPIITCHINKYAFWLVFCRFAKKKKKKKKKKQVRFSKTIHKQISFLKNARQLWKRFWKMYAFYYYS